MNNLWRELLSKISDRRLKLIGDTEANELNLDIEDLEEQLKLLQDEGYLEVKKIAWRMWEVRITSEGYRFLNETSEI